MNYLKITLYISEADKWKHRPLHIELLNFLHNRGIAGGTVFHAVAGFTNKGNVQTTSLVDVGSKLPLVVQFIDTEEHVEAVLPELKEMVGQRLIISEPVKIISSGFKP